MVLLLHDLLGNSTLDFSQLLYHKCFVFLGSLLVGHRGTSFLLCGFLLIYSKTVYLLGRKLFFTLLFVILQKLAMLFVDDFTAQIIRTRDSSLELLEFIFYNCFRRGICQILVRSFMIRWQIDEILVTLGRLFSKVVVLAEFQCILRMIDYFSFLIHIKNIDEYN